MNQILRSDHKYSSLVIIDDFNIVDVSIAPCEANPPLQVYANAVLTFPVPMQCFKVIAWGNSKSLDIHNSIKHIKFAKRYTLNRMKTFACSFRFESLCFFAFKVNDHRPHLCFDNNIQCLALNARRKTRKSQIWKKKHWGYCFFIGIWYNSIDSNRETSIDKTMDSKTSRRKNEKALHVD